MQSVAGAGPMEETPAARNKAFISEEDVLILLSRYQPTTILKLLQEVSEIASPKIDWNTFVKQTATGITSARECQMLWRHLAYRDSLLEKVEETEPLDDDSDLEFELEAVPETSSEEVSEAVAFVKKVSSGGVNLKKVQKSKRRRKANVTRRRA